MRKNISLVIQESTFDVGLDQYSNGNGGSGATAATAASAATTATRTPRKNIERDQNPAGLDSNLVTLMDFKKSLLEEQKKGEEVSGENRSKRSPGVGQRCHVLCVIVHVERIDHADERHQREDV